MESWRIFDNSVPLMNPGLCGHLPLGGGIAVIVLSFQTRIFRGYFVATLPQRFLL